NIGSDCPSPRAGMVSHKTMRGQALGRMAQFVRIVAIPLNRSGKRRLTGVADTNLGRTWVGIDPPRRRSAGRITLIGWFLIAFGEIKLLDPAIEAGPGDSQDLGGAGLIAAGLSQSGLDQPALDFGQQLVERLDRAGWSWWGEGRSQVALDRCGQVLRIDQA